MTCPYLGRQCGNIVTPEGRQALYRCTHPDHRTTTLRDCEACPDKPTPTEQRAHVLPPDFYQATGPLTTDQRRVDLRQLYQGAAAFLCVGGPSMRTMPLHLLGQRGALIASYNNNAAVLPTGLRPHVWLHTDPPRKFSDQIWRDPAVLKFSPTQEWRSTKGKNCPWKNVREKRGDEWTNSSRRAFEWPGVIGYTRNTEFNPDTWLTEATVNRGNCIKSAATNGHPHTINTLFAALKVLWVLGFARVYIVGADFRMEPEQPYAFGQTKSRGGVNATNEAFHKLNWMLGLLRPRFDVAGFEVWNATNGGHCTAFERIDFRAAVARETKDFTAAIDARGWYDE